jgi:predicted HD phosphohydrolase
MSMAPSTGYPTRMDEFDTAYCEILGKAIEEDARLTADRVLANLRALEPIVQEFAVDQLVHALQTATRAERAGEELDVVVGALCHDMAKTIINANHDKIAGEMVRPYLSEEVTWMVAHHQDFQGRHYYDVLGLDPDAREQYRGHRSFDLTARFADDYDQVSFDPDYDTLPLEHFEPMVREVFGRQPSTIL